MIKLFEERYSHLLDHELSGESIAAEVDFIESVIGFDQAKLILDLGAGACRRSLELARRGYLVVGFSLCEVSLEEARKRAEAERLSAQFVRGDARALVYKTQFDLALLLQRELDRRSLTRVGRALKPGGILILTAPNMPSNGIGLQPPAAQLLGRLAEPAGLLHALGFSGVEFFAVTERGFRRHAPPSAEDQEIGVIAVKNSCAHSHFHQ